MRSRPTAVDIASGYEIADLLEVLSLSAGVKIKVGTLKFVTK